MRAKNRIVRILATTLFLNTALFVSAANAEEQQAVTRAMLLGAMCETCHGIGGVGANSNPGINGGGVDEFVALMQAYVTGEAKTTVMDRHAKGYTDEDFKNLAEYFKQY